MPERLRRWQRVELSESREHDRLLSALQHSASTLGRATPNLDGFHHGGTAMRDNQVASGRRSADGDGIMATRSVFVSFDYDVDRRYRDLLRAWNANSDFQFEFTETSPRVAINSNEAAVVKRVLTQRIAAANYFLCIIGEQTFGSDWVTWEIEKAKELKKRLVAVKLDRENPTPSALYGSGASWAMSFTLESIQTALQKV